MSLFTPNSTLYGVGNKPYFISYSGGSTYTTQTYCEPPKWKLANNMTTEFGAAISGVTEPVAVFNGGVFNGYADGFWIYRFYLNGDLVATYQFVDQLFCVPVEFDRVEAFCMSTEMSSSYAFSSNEQINSTPIPATSSLMFFAVAIAAFRRKQK